MLLLCQHLVGVSTADVCLGGLVLLLYPKSQNSTAHSLKIDWFKCPESVSYLFSLNLITFNVFNCYLVITFHTLPYEAFIYLLDLGIQHLKKLDQ